MISHYGVMEILSSITEDEIVESFSSIARHGLRFFNLTGIGVYDFWAKIFCLRDDNPQRNSALLIIEICMCALICNTSLEMLFNQMNIVKSNMQNRLTNSALNTLLRIKFSKLPVDSLQKNDVSRCVEYWFKKKDQRMVQGKRKRYQCRKSKISKRPNFDFSTMLSSSSSQNSESNIDIEVEHV